MRNYNQLKIKTDSISNKEKEKINKFIIKNNGLIFHQVEFNEILSANFNSSFHYEVFESNGEIVALCPIHAFKSGILSRNFSGILNFEVPYGGWIYKNDLAEERLFNKIKLSSFGNLEYWANPFGLKKSQMSSINKYYTAIIDLSLNEEALLNSVISANTRHNIRRAIKKGLSIQYFDLIEIDLFLEQVETFKSTYIQDFSLLENRINFIKEIFIKYNPDSAYIIAVAKGSTLLSTIMIIGNSNFHHAWVAGRIGEIPKNLYQNELLWWESILHAKQLNAKKYDLCYIYSEKQLFEKHTKQMNIAQFKMGFSKELVPFYCISKKSLFFRIINRMQNEFINIRKVK